MRTLFAIALGMVFIAVCKGPAAASCSAASRSATAAYSAYEMFEDRLFKHGDSRGAIVKYNEGANAAHSARAASCGEQPVLARVLAVSAALSAVHASLELDAAPDSAEPQCVPEHRDVAKSDIANAWIAIETIGRIRQVPPLYAHITSNVRLVANRLGMPLPDLGTSPQRVNEFLARYQFDGRGQCFHNTPP
jgi:hypothetical protein